MKYWQNALGISILLFFVSLSGIVQANYRPMAPLCPPDDSTALVALYNSTNGPAWTTTWDLNTDYDTWAGVTADTNGCVLALDLAGFGLDGTLPADLSNLEELRRLDVSNNALVGPLPNSLSGLNRLDHLNLSSNAFTGAVPDFVGTLVSCDTINLSNNQFDGTLPGTFATNDSIRFLYLNNNFIESSPALTGSPTSILEIAIENNRLTFESLEANIALGIPTFTYDPQDSTGTVEVRTVCEGLPFRDTLTTLGQFNRYRWVKDGAEVASDSILEIPNVTVADAGAYILETTNDVVTGTTIYHRALVLQVIPAPTNNTLITQDTVICEGDPLPTLFGEVVDGQGLSFTYLWQESSDSASWTDAVNFQNYPLAASGNTYSDTTWFRRLVQSSCGVDTSETTKLIIVPLFGPNEITPQTQAVCNGDSSLVIEGTNVQDTSIQIFDFQWQYSRDLQNWRDTLGDMRDFPAGTPTDTLHLRRLVLGGCAPDTSALASIYFIPDVAGDSVWPLTQFVCANTLPDSLFGEEATGGDGSYTYYWQELQDLTDSTQAWVSVDSSANNPNFQPPIISDTTFYRRLVRSGCSLDSSETIQLLIAPDLGVNDSIWADYFRVCPNDSLPMLYGPRPTIDSTGIPLDSGFYYVWETSLDTTNWEVALDSSSQNFQPLDSLFDGSFYARRLIIDSCQTYTSNTIFIERIDSIQDNFIELSLLDTLDSAAFIPTSSFCAGDTLWYVRGSEPTGGAQDTAYQYLWQVSFDSLTWGDRDTARSLAGFSISDTIVYLRRLVLDSCYADTSNILEIPVFPRHGPNEITSQRDTICAGEVFDLVGTLPEAEIGTFTYLWQFSPDSATWFVADTVMTTDSLFTQNFTPDTLTQTTYFRRVVQGGCVDDTSQAVVVVVQPNVRNNFLLSGDQFICLGDSAQEIIASNLIDNGLTYDIRWQQSFDSTDWFRIAGGDSLFNYHPGAVERTSYFRRLVSVPGCNNVVSNAVKITVYPPLGNNAIFEDQEICEGDSAAIVGGTLPTGGDSTYVYIWQFLPEGDSVWVTISGAKDLRPGTPEITGSYRRIVESASCFSDTSNTITIIVNERFTINSITGDQTVCQFDSVATLIGVDIVDSLNMLMPVSYQWQMRTDSLWEDVPRGRDINYTPPGLAETTRFRRLATNDCYTDSSNIVTVRILPLPDVDAGPDTVVVIGYSVQLEVTGAADYVWLNGAETMNDDSIRNPIATPTIATDYIVKGTDRNGCVNYDTVRVEVIYTPNVRIVEAITPNDDDLNEVLYIENIERYPDNTLIIFDRRGKEIYRKQGYNNEWNGTYNGNKLPNGVYFYMLKFGVTSEVVKGSFMIMASP